MDARIPLRESEDEIYNTSYYSRDPRNLPNEVIKFHPSFLIIVSLKERSLLKYF